MPSKVGKRIEKWSETLFPGYDIISIEKYNAFHGRELVIVASAILELALVDLLSMRLVKNDEIIDKFLGISGDYGGLDFNKRIDLSYLLGLIGLVEAQTLHSLRGLRNLMAHRVNINLCDPNCLKYVMQLIDQFHKPRKELIANEVITDMKNEASASPLLAEFLIRTILIDYQFNFDKRKISIKRLTESSRYFSGSFE
jgi:hypothetical protein